MNADTIYGDSMEDIMTYYSPEAENTKGMTFDFSLMYLYGRQDIWQVYPLSDLEKIQDLVCDIEEDDEGENNFIEVAKAGLEKHGSQYESNEDLYLRGQQVKGFLADYLEFNPLNATRAEKYGIITHQNMLKALTSCGIDEDGEYTNAKEFRPCELGGISI
mmetsp:Transcript_25390/g.24737  ORF Transcript_25390/g.24737 Transcript_25390/m.24737 type:complete len:161 (-) Transcript_25390:48-530(-)